MNGVFGLSTLTGVAVETIAPPFCTSYTVTAHTNAYDDGSVTVTEVSVPVAIREAICACPAEPEYLELVTFEKPVGMSLEIALALLGTVVSAPYTDAISVSPAPGVHASANVNVLFGAALPEFACVTQRTEGDNGVASASALRVPPAPCAAGGSAPGPPPHAESTADSNVTNANHSEVLGFDLCDTLRIVAVSLLSSKSYASERAHSGP
jgi:hypothetical protein